MEVTETATESESETTEATTASTTAAAKEPSLPSLSDELLLNTLWDTLSACLRDLADTPDHHAVLVLQVSSCPNLYDLALTSPILLRLDQSCLISLKQYSCIAGNCRGLFPSSCRTHAARGQEKSPAKRNATRTACAYSRTNRQHCRGNSRACTRNEFRSRGY